MGTVLSKPEGQVDNMQDTGALQLPPALETLSPDTSFLLPWSFCLPGPSQELVSPLLSSPASDHWSAPGLLSAPLLSFVNTVLDEVHSHALKTLRIPQNAPFT